MKNKKIIFVGIGLLIISYGYYFLNFRFGFAIPCLFNFITGLYCPGCGVTRMIFSILRFDFYQALRYNPLLFILGIIYILFSIIKYIKKSNLIISDKIYYLLIIVLLIYGVIRNVPFFEFLQPTVI